MSAPTPSLAAQLAGAPPAAVFASLDAHTRIALVARYAETVTERQPPASRHAEARHTCLRAIRAWLAEPCAAHEADVVSAADQLNEAGDARSIGGWLTRVAADGTRGHPPTITQFVDAAGMIHAFYGADTWLAAVIAELCEGGPVSERVAWELIDAGAELDTALTAASLLANQPA